MWGAAAGCFVADENSASGGLLRHSLLPSSRHSPLAAGGLKYAERESVAFKRVPSERFSGRLPVGGRLDGMWDPWRWVR
eukprot:1742424-Prymnesium_polylepis.1